MSKASRSFCRRKYGQGKSRCDILPEFTDEDVKWVVKELGILATDADKNLLREGMNVEREHCDITNGNPLKTARIALAHLEETQDYYEKLKKAGL